MLIMHARICRAVAKRIRRGCFFFAHFLTFFYFLGDNDGNITEFQDQGSAFDTNGRATNLRDIGLLCICHFRRVIFRRLEGSSAYAIMTRAANVSVNEYGIISWNGRQRRQNMTNFVARIVFGFASNRFQAEYQFNYSVAYLLSFRGNIARRQRASSSRIKASSRTSSGRIEVFANRFRLLFDFRSSSDLIRNCITRRKPRYVFAI